MISSQNKSLEDESFHTRRGSKTSNTNKQIQTQSWTVVNRQCVTHSVELSKIQKEVHRSWEECRLTRRFALPESVSGIDDTNQSSSVNYASVDESHFYVPDHSEDRSFSNVDSDTLQDTSSVRIEQLSNNEDWSEDLTESEEACEYALTSTAGLDEDEIELKDSTIPESTIECDEEINEISDKIQEAIDMKSDGETVEVEIESGSLEEECDSAQENWYRPLAFDSDKLTDTDAKSPYDSFTDWEELSIYQLSGNEDDDIHQREYSESDYDLMNISSEGIDRNDDSHSEKRSSSSQLTATNSIDRYLGNELVEKFGIYGWLYLDKLNEKYQNLQEFDEDRDYDSKCSTCSRENEMEVSSDVISLCSDECTETFYLKTLFPSSDECLPSEQNQVVEDEREGENHQRSPKKVESGKSDVLLSRIPFKSDDKIMSSLNLDKFFVTSSDTDEMISSMNLDKLFATSSDGREKDIDVKSSDPSKCNVQRLNWLKRIRFVTSEKKTPYEGYSDKEVEDNSDQECVAVDEDTFSDTSAYFVDAEESSKCQENGPSDPLSRKEVMVKSEMMHKLRKQKAVIIRGVRHRRRNRKFRLKNSRATTPTPAKENERSVMNEGTNNLNHNEPVEEQNLEEQWENFVEYFDSQKRYNSMSDQESENNLKYSESNSNRDETLVKESYDYCSVAELEEDHANLCSSGLGGDRGKSPTLPNETFDRRQRCPLCGRKSFNDSDVCLVCHLREELENIQNSRLHENGANRSRNQNRVGLNEDFFRPITDGLKTVVSVLRAGECAIRRFMQW